MFLTRVRFGEKGVRIRFLSGYQPHMGRINFNSLTFAALNT